MDTILESTEICMWLTWSSESKISICFIAAVSYTANYCSALKATDTLMSGKIHTVYSWFTTNLFNLVLLKIPKIALSGCIIKIIISVFMYYTDCGEGKANGLNFPS